MPPFCLPVSICITCSIQVKVSLRNRLFDILYHFVHLSWWSWHRYQYFGLCFISECIHLISVVYGKVAEERNGQFNHPTPLENNQFTIWESLTGTVLFHCFWGDWGCCWQRCPPPRLALMTWYSWDPEEERATNSKSYIQRLSNLCHKEERKTNQESTAQSFFPFFPQLFPRTLPPCCFFFWYTRFWSCSPFQMHRIFSAFKTSPSEKADCKQRSWIEDLVIANWSGKLDSEPTE